MKAGNRALAKTLTHYMNNYWDLKTTDKASRFHYPICIIGGLAEARPYEKLLKSS